jgi:nucleoside-diphosphate-sugar epimerase
MKILVTGASGFVGQALCEVLGRNHQVRAAVRLAPTRALQCPQIVVGPIDHATDWRDALKDQEVLIHLLARVHVMKDASEDPLAEFRAVNVVGSMNVARQAAAMGVRRMVFVSSIKVNGEYSLPGHALTEDEPASPGEAYGVSKLEAEKGLRRMADETGLEMVIVRPPLVYGRGVKANFAALMRAVRRGWPLPLGAVNNRRSLVGLGNLTHFLEVCATHPGAGDQIFYVSDGEDLSTPELIRRMAAAGHVKAHLIRVPVGMLEAGAALLGRREAMQRLCGNLQVDISKARDLLGWTPPFSVDDGLRETISAADAR